MSKKSGREAVEVFFNNRIIEEPKTLGDIFSSETFGPIFVVSAISGVIIFYLFQNLPIAVALAVVIAAITAYAILKSSKNRSEKSKQEFLRLAKEVQNIQAEDAQKAMLRVFDRTQIDMERLRILDQKYIFEKEKDLFDQDTNLDRLKELQNRSLRFISRANHRATKTKRIIWSDGAPPYWLYNPMRQTTIFISDTQFVICDVEINSITGNPDEDIQRIGLDSIVSIRFKSSRDSDPLKKLDVLNAAEDLGLDKPAIEKIEADLAKYEDLEETNYVYEITTSELAFTRTDSNNITVPIKNEIYFGPRVSSLDGENNLSEDEVKIDKMMNELNKLVEER